MREREGGRESERERWTDGQTNRQTDRQREVNRKWKVFARVCLQLDLMLIVSRALLYFTND